MTTQNTVGIDEVLIIVLGDGFGQCCANCTTQLVEKRNIFLATQKKQLVCARILPTCCGTERPILASFTTEVEAQTEIKSLIGTTRKMIAGMLPEFLNNGMLPL